MSRTHSRRLRLAVLCVLSLAAATAAACTSATREQAQGADADSVRLERLPGFTRIPGYRVSVARDGRVAFAWLASGDSARPAADSLAPATAAALIDAGSAAGVGRLPERLREHPDLCGPWATDHGTAVVTLFYAAGRTARVEDYLGCRDAPAELRAYEARIDTIARTGRWTSAYAP